MCPAFDLLRCGSGFARFGIDIWFSCLDLKCPHACRDCWCSSSGVRSAPGRLVAVAHPHATCATHPQVSGRFRGAQRSSTGASDQLQCCLSDALKFGRSLNARRCTSVIGTNRKHAAHASVRSKFLQIFNGELFQDLVVSMIPIMLTPTPLLGKDPSMTLCATSPCIGT